MRLDIVWGFLAGTATGVAIGLLCADRPGRESREYLKRQATKTLDNMASAGREVGNRIANAVATGQEQASEAVGAAKEAYSENL